MALRRPPTEDEIAQRAFELYQQRNHGDGQAAQDLADAKRELEAASAAEQQQDMEIAGTETLVVGDETDASLPVVAAVAIGSGEAADDGDVQAAREVIKINQE